MTPKELKIIYARINEELENIAALLDELNEKKLFDESAGFINDSFYLRSIVLTENEGA